MRVRTGTARQSGFPGAAGRLNRRDARRQTSDATLYSGNAISEDRHGRPGEGIDGRPEPGARHCPGAKGFSHVGQVDWQFADLHAGIDTTLKIVGNEIRHKAQIARQYGVLPQVRCLPSQLNQVFMNLLVNAARALRGKTCSASSTRSSPPSQSGSVPVSACRFRTESSGSTVARSASIVRLV